MKKFRDLAIKYKILFGFFGILVVFLVLGAYFIYSTGAISKASRQVEARNFTGVELTTNLELIMNNIIQLAHEIEVIEAENSMLGHIGSHKKEIEIGADKFRVLLSEFKELVKNEPVILEKAVRIGNLFEKYRAMIKAEIESRLAGNIFQNAEEEIISKQLRQNLMDLRNEDISALSWALGRIDRLARDIRNDYFWLLLFVFIISVFVACIIAKIIIMPIRYLIWGMRKLANGSLDYEIEVKSRDEIGTLQAGFMNMAGRLRKAYSDLQKEKDNLEIKVKERTKDLEENQGHLKENISMLEKIREELKKKVEELEKFSKLAVDRELRMIELKQKIKELEDKQNA